MPENEMASVDRPESHFGWALQRLKAGAKVTRGGWNGKGQYLYYVPANSYKAVTDIAKAAFGDMVPYRAYIAIKTVQGDVVPWVASQTDLLATDWCMTEYNPRAAFGVAW